MAAFNYRQLIRQIPARTWECYFQSRKLELPDQLAGDNLISSVIDIIDALPAAQGEAVYAELRRVHDLANGRGVDALRNTAPPDSALHEDFTKFSSDAERALWVMANWPDLFATAEAIYAVSLRIGKRGWKRLRPSMTPRQRRRAVPTHRTSPCRACWASSRPRSNRPAAPVPSGAAPLQRRPGRRQRKLRCA